LETTVTQLVQGLRNPSVPGLIRPAASFSPRSRGLFFFVTISCYANSEFRHAIFPQVQRDLPQVQRDLPQVQRDLPQMQRDLPQVQRDLPQQQRDLPQVQRVLPQMQRDLPQTQRDLP